MAIMPLVFGSACAADRQTIADVQCIVVAMKMGAASGSAQQVTATMITLYYLGRLDERIPGMDIEGLIVKEAAKMSRADLRSEAARCGRALTEKGLEIQRIGNRLGE
jgi:hypothetical protein